MINVLFYLIKMHFVILLSSWQKPNWPSRFEWRFYFDHKSSELAKTNVKDSTFLQVLEKLLMFSLMPFIANHLFPLAFEGRNLYIDASVMYLMIHVQWLNDWKLIQRKFQSVFEWNSGYQRLSFTTPCDCTRSRQLC